MADLRGIRGGVFAVFAVVAATVSVRAHPIAAAGTEGLELYVATSGPVIVTYKGSTASYSNSLYLAGFGLLFNNKTSANGATINLGSFAAGTELELRLHVNNTGEDFYIGPGSDNPDGLAHARAENDWLQPDITLVSFEDLRNEPEGIHGFNDFSVSFGNTFAAADASARDSQLPAPVLPGVLGLAMGGFEALRRRRRKR